MSRPRKNDRHLPPCVHFRHGAYYYVKGGKWERLSADLTDALVLYSQKVSKPKNGMDQLIDKVMKSLREREKPRPLAAGTLKQYTQAAERLKVIFANFSPEQVKPKHIMAITESLASTPNMANRILSFMRTVFNHAVKWQLIDSNPCFGVAGHEEEKRKRYITDAEYTAIREHANPRLKCIMDLCYLTGQRIVDVLEIRMSDITPEGIAFKQQKTDARLVVRSSPDTEKVIAAAKLLSRPKIRSLTLFSSTRGGAPAYSTVRSQWIDACTAAGVKDVTLHDLRAKSGTDAEKQGHNPTALLGHTSEAQTKRYLRDRKIPVVSGPSFGQSN